MQKKSRLKAGFYQHIFNILLKYEVYGECKKHFYCFSTLLSGDPFRGGHYHPDGFLIQCRINTTDNHSIYNCSHFVHCKLNDNTPADSVLCSNFRIPQVLGNIFPEFSCRFTSVKCRHILHNVEYLLLLDFFVDTPGRGLPSGDLEPHFLPVTVRFPGSDQVFNTGLGSAAVPGNLKGYLHAHRRLGRLPLGEVLAPAIGLAREGVQLNRHQAYFLELLRPILTLTPAGRSLYEPGGRYLGEGDRLVNPDLASFLEDLPANRGRDFYTGALADQIGRDMAAGGGSPAGYATRYTVLQNGL